MIALRPVTREDVAALVAIQHARAGTMNRRSHASLERELFDAAHGHGAHVEVAVEGMAVRGAVGRVVGGDQGFLAPVIAATDAVAEALVLAGVGALRAAGARTVRASAGEPAGPVARAYAAAGFVPVFEFIELARTSGWLDHDVPRHLAIRPLDAVDREAVRVMHNLSIVGTPNALPMTAADVADAIDGPGTFGLGSSVVIGPAGAPYAVLFAGHDRDDRGEYASVEMVAVDPDRRGAGLARALVGRLVTVAHAAGIPEVRALIASTNVASMALHRRLEFTDLYRRTVYELEL
jgi:ribosomal protein S18 acetylase RimI-like enzyme